MNVLVKGGHLEGDAIDVLVTSHGVHEFPSERYDTVHTHGTGCTYSAAITAELAKGEPIVEAVRLAKEFIARRDPNHPRFGRRLGAGQSLRSLNDQYLGTLGSTLSLQARMPPFMLRTRLEPGLLQEIDRLQRCACRSCSGRRSRPT